MSPADAQRFWSRVAAVGNVCECWEWTAHRSGGGYGRITIGRKSTAAHRVAYELVVGPIPAGLCLDHLCRNRGCVNPAHLEPVTIRENNMRGISPTAIAAAKTHCPRGHAYAGDNLRMCKGGRNRQCRTCIRLFKAARKRRAGDRRRLVKAGMARANIIREALACVRRQLAVGPMATTDDVLEAAERELLGEGEVKRGG